MPLNVCACQVAPRDKLGSAASASPAAMVSLMPRSAHQFLRHTWGREGRSRRLLGCLAKDLVALAPGFFPLATPLPVCWPPSQVTSASSSSSSPSTTRSWQDSDTPRPGPVTPRVWSTLPVPVTVTGHSRGRGQGHCLSWYARPFDLMPVGWGWCSWGPERVGNLLEVPELRHCWDLIPGPRSPLLTRFRTQERLMSQLVLRLCGASVGSVASVGCLSPDHRSWSGLTGWVLKTHPVQPHGVTQGKATREALLVASEVTVTSDSGRPVQLRARVSGTVC